MSRAHVTHLSCIRAAACRARQLWGMGSGLPGCRAPRTAAFELEDAAAGLVSPVAGECVVEEGGAPGALLHAHAAAVLRLVAHEHAAHHRQVGRCIDVQRAACGNIGGTINSSMGPHFNTEETECR